MAAIIRLENVMNENVITIITAITLVVSGAFAGYVTNKYAVRWLFKPVTIFGKQIFDVSILSTDRKQEAFIESLSDCVERRILTADVIKTELISDAVKAHLDEIVEVFLSQALPAELKHVSLSELGGFGDSAEGIKRLVKDMAEENIGGLLDCLFDEIKVSDYLTVSQIDRGVDNAYEAVKLALKENYVVRDLVGRIAGELFLQAMFDKDGRAAAAKIASKFFKGGQMRPGPTGPFNIDEVTLPEKIRDSIKEIITKAVVVELKDKSLGEILDANTKNELEYFGNNLLREKLDDAADNLPEEKLLEVVSKTSKRAAKNEGIKQDFSNLIFGFLKDNIESILEGKVKHTVKLALGKLDPDQLLEVAEKLMKGQLAYLSYFGAVLGFIISIPALVVTLGSFTATGFPGSAMLLLFLVVLMGAIGVLTNVIAIQMFFHPYKPIGFLAKHKKTKVFSLGIILQNQRPFANTLGEYVGSTLLTSENIIDTLKKNVDGFEESIVSAVVDGIKERLEDEAIRTSLADRLTVFLLNSLDSNRADIANRICLGAGGKIIDEYINLNDPTIREKYDEIFDRLLDRLADNIPSDYAAGSDNEEVSPLGLFGAALGINIAMTRENQAAAKAEDDEASDFRFIIWVLAKLIRKSPSLKEKTREVLLVFVQNEFSKKGLGDIFSMKELSESIENNLRSIAASEAAFAGLLDAVKACSSAFVERFSTIVSDNMLKNLILTGARAGFEALISEIPSLVKDIHIGEVTEERVAALEPEEIKNVIISFAGEAIHKLYALGLICCIFGINTYLAFVIFIIDKIREK